jgi:hypothetical protein
MMMMVTLASEHRPMRIMTSPPPAMKFQTEAKPEEMVARKGGISMMQAQ